MNNINDLIKNTINRMRYIEFCLIYKGEVSRSDLIRKFGIKEASATRDLKQYMDDTNSKNAHFDSRLKKHLILDKTFVPLFKITDEEALFWLKVESFSTTNEFLTYRFKRLSLPGQNVLAPISRAIINNKCVKIEYMSLNSGKGADRVVIPHAIFDDGLRIYIRVFDRKRNKFLDFSASRVVNAKLLEEEPKESEMKKNDDEWNKIIDLSLVPHPKIDHKEVVEYEYKMIREKLKVSIRSSLAGYFLRVWNVDCSSHATLPHKTYHLYFENRKEFEENSNIKLLAPGFDN